MSHRPVASGRAVETGPAVEGLPTGSDFYRCDVHPTTMTGTLEVG